MATLKVPFVRNPYNYDVMDASDASGLSCPEKSLTQQNFREECDINVIMERFGQGMQIPEGYREPQYGDFTGVTDYHSAMNAVAKAGEAFDMLPALVRARFQNDPAQFVDFVTDESNREEAIKLGLIVKAPSGTPEGAPASEPEGGA